MIVAIVLAAGRAGRFGAPKLVAPFAGEPLLRWPVRALLAAGVDAVHVVVGEEVDAMAEALAGLPVRIVRHPGARGGVGTSIAAGAASLGAEVRAMLVALGDQPTLAPAAVEAVVARWREGDGARIVVPSYRGERGHPVLFDAAVFDELRVLEGDVGARVVVARDPGRVAVVELDAGLPPDVDTPEELAALERARGAAARAAARD